MERLAASGDKSQPLSDEQKAQMAEIDEKYRAKVAERELFLTPKLAQAQATGQFADAEDIRKQLVNEKARLEEEREAEKEKIRNR